MDEFTTGAKKRLRRNQVLTVAWILMWVGAILLIACWLTKLWFQMVIPLTPVCLVALGLGLCLFVIGRRLH
ncbi:hypothetical protein [Alicyclobacillus acidoterrestris]|uniref:Uncharacterized protein n=1 Tax=Alicyclobacillus acidoterrestris (strain ATCC 49025 / DSM 3922 / CIP 106132 / NCIMB 13137 / GD3B) TaxID=1356854 RepID=T0DPY5_ALIAG|nr:hypothetical protein [Alicyclobacillus acidoterrestris]EPZ51526.1 hypothetical protein N007_02925 [Alicyclobacillus acidoterrestris ATCC 49025]UNO50596.1 hypothetical protein K1I37_09190 [Alicyclobacillus acidoterrestris]